MAYDFTGKVVIITGSSSGIGEDSAVEFARAGAQPVVTGRNAERVALVANRCNEASAKNLKALTVIGDVSNDADAKQLVDETIAAFGQINILINNAGFGKKAAIGDENLVDVMDEVYRTNVRALVNLTNLASEHLVKTKGNIINISSVASTRPGFGSIPYSVSKAAVDMVTQCSAIELGPKGVRVNSLNPAMIETAFFANLGFTSAVESAFAKLSALIYPMKRIGKVSDTTAGILFLASDQASFYTGVNLPVDGGYLTMSPMAAHTVMQQQ